MSPLRDFSEQTVLSLLLQALERDASHRILRDCGRELSLEELHRRSSNLAAGLSSIGLKQGNRVGVLVSSAERFVVTWFSLWHLGAILVPINGELRHRQLEHVLEHSEINCLILDREGQTTLESLPGESQISLGGVVLCDTEPECPKIRQLQADTTCSWEELVTSGASRADPIRVSPKQPAAILYTGGTTGPSKGVVCSHCQYYWWATLMARILEIQPGDTWFTCLPFFHINAQATLLATLETSAGTATAGRFSASRYWQQVREARATVASLLGTMAYILFQSRAPAPEDRQHGLRAIFCPGISAAVKPAFEERFGVPVVNAYGMTELNCVSATALNESSPAASMGRPLEEFELAVVDENDQPVERGVQGEFIVRPRRPFSVMSGYFRMPEETLGAWRNLWFHTGDRGYQDSQGNLYFVDRLKDCIRRRGENISSQDIESVVTAHPAVLEAAAYPVPSELGEDDVMVSLVLKPGQRPTMQDLIAWCEQRLARFAVPRYLRVTPDLPKTAVGRVQKFSLRAAGVTSDTWDRERSAPL